MLKTLYYAIKGLFRNPKRSKKITIFIIVILLLFAITNILAWSVENLVLAFLIRWVWIPLSLLFLILRHGEVVTRYRFRRFFCSIRMFGIDNRLPEYMWATVINRHLVQYRFKSQVHPCDWKKEQHSFEMYFKKKVHKIKESEEDITMIDIFVIQEKLPGVILWQDDFMEEGRKFAIGENYGCRTIWDVTELPHGLVAGSSSSGKTSLIRSIVHQAINKRFNVSIIDMKGGGDFSSVEREYMKKYKDLENGYGSLLISEPKKARDLLLALNVEVRGRLKSFKEAGVSNIDEYNAKGKHQFIPWLLVIDEAAEILDVKPKDKDEKALYTEIDSLLRTLARLSRAAGVHILMGVIRPSHDVLDGQIKNNLLWRACGYFADSPASRIVLENDKATELPPDVKGRFIIGENEVQAYYLPVPSQS